MLSVEHLQAVEQIARQLNERQLAWLSGYLAGLQEHPPQSNGKAQHLQLTAQTLGEKPPTALVLYGSHGGNGESIAQLLATAATAAGLAVKAVSMADYQTAKLTKEKLLLVIISTHGDGEPPDAAAGFYEFLHRARAPKLPSLRYATLALGDSTYQFFCQSGRDVHARLAELGATPILPLAECDVDFERPAEQWRQKIIDALSSDSKTGQNGGHMPNQAVIGDDVIFVDKHMAATPITVPMFNRQNPFFAPLLSSVVLTAPPRQNRHLEFSLEDSNLHYQPGDSLGVWPQNPSTVAQRTAELLGLDWEEELTIDGEQATTAAWLTEKLDICRLSPPMLERYYKLVGGDALRRLMRDAAAVRRYLCGRRVIEMLMDFTPPPDVGAAVLACLRRLTPRLYSLASAPSTREGEAHILVSYEQYMGSDQRLHTGLCSNYLAHLQEGEQVRVFVQKNDAFRLPKENGAPLVMIGSGSGVAPFRAFMEEREERGDSGKSWLFFGERRRRDDFYYQTEWQARLKNGALTRLTAAFSRDGGNKTYVQNSIATQGAELWRWLQEGGYVYVCGGETMAKGVHTALAELATAHGSIDGKAFLAELRQAGRYQRDVY